MQEPNRVVSLRKDSFNDKLLMLRRNEVHTLSLFFAPLSSDELKLFVEALNANTSLKRLWLSNSYSISNEQTNLIFNGLNSNSPIVEIDFTWCNIDDIGASYVAEYLKRNHELRALKLKGDCMGDAGIEMLAKALAQNKGLCELYIGSTKVGSTTREKVDYLWESALTNPNVISLIGPCIDKTLHQALEQKKERITKLAKEWIEYKSHGVQLTSHTETFEKYSNPIKYILDGELKEPDLAGSFDVDLGRV